MDDGENIWTDDGESGDLSVVLYGMLRMQVAPRERRYLAGDYVNLAEDAFSFTVVNV